MSTQPNSNLWAVSNDGLFLCLENKRKAVPFKKGQSGNPGGRPKAHGDFRNVAREFMDLRGVNTLLRMAEDDGEDRRFSLKLLAEYAYGKPQQHVDLTTQGGPLFKAYVGVDTDRV